MLDTNVCIRYLNGRAPALKARIDATRPEELVVCSVVKAELFDGAARSNDPAKALALQQRFLSGFVSLPFDDPAANAYAGARAALASTGQPVGPNDLLIAAIALANDVTLVTHNAREFARVPGLRIDDRETTPP